MTRPAIPPVIEAAQRKDICRMLKELSYREREVLKLRYGLGVDGLKYTQEEVGHIFKVTRERIRSTERKALVKLAAVVAADELPPAPKAPATCETCRFWKNRVPDWGYCKRFPPVLVSSMVDWEVDDEEGRLMTDMPAGMNATQFPVTSLDNWCGEHQPREADQ